MEKVKLFRRANNLSQQTLADYLGVTQGFISQVEKGMCVLSENQLGLIFANDKGWDISMLKDAMVHQNITNNGSIAGGVSQTNVPSVPGVSPELMESLMKQLEENRKMLVLLAEQLSNSNKLNEWLREQLDKRR